MPRIPESEIERLKSEVSVERLVEASGIAFLGGFGLVERAYAKRHDPVGRKNRPAHRGDPDVETECQILVVAFHCGLLV